MEYLILSEPTPELVVKALQNDWEVVAVLPVGVVFHRLKTPWRLILAIAVLAVLAIYLA